MPKPHHIAPHWFISLSPGLCPGATPSLPVTLYLSLCWDPALSQHDRYQSYQGVHCLLTEIIMIAIQLSRYKTEKLTIQVFDVKIYSSTGCQWLTSVISATWMLIWGWFHFESSLRKNLVRTNLSQQLSVVMLTWHPSFGEKHKIVQLATAKSDTLLPI